MKMNKSHIIPLISTFNTVWVVTLPPSVRLNSNVHGYFNPCFSLTNKFWLCEKICIVYWVILLQWIFTQSLGGGHENLFIGAYLFYTAHCLMALCQVSGSLLYGIPHMKSLVPKQLMSKLHVSHFLFFKINEQI